jgi:polyisoprenoid-binding protein YceI
MATTTTPAKPATKWFFEPGHTAAEFIARHMMVTWVRGTFKNVSGDLEFDEDRPLDMKVDVTIKTDTLYTGEPTRDAHLRSADFLDVEHHPTMEFHSTGVKVIGKNDYDVSGNLTIRGVTKPLTMHVNYLGQWDTPWWEDGVNKGTRRRAGFVAKTCIQRKDFGVSWNDIVPNGGVVVGDSVDLVIDAEAVKAG